MNVERSTIGTLTIAILAIVALGLVATTLTSMASTGISDVGQGGVGGGDDDGTIGGGQEQVDGENLEQSDQLGQESQRPLDIPKICIPFLAQGWVFAVMLGSIVLVIGLAYRQFQFLGAAFSVYLVAMPVALAYTFLTQCPNPPGGPAGSPLGRITEATEGLGGAAAGTTIPPTAIAAVFAVAAIGAIALLISATGDETVSAETEELIEEEEPEMSEFAATAGTAADRIENTNTPVDNAVYRAWLEMTNLLDFEDPDTVTPGEFADAAIDIGMEEEDINQLTRLFEEVRYGEMDPEPREDLAVQTLRNIEAAYGMEEDTTNEAEGGEQEE